MHAEVNQRTAAGKRLIAEPTARAASAAQINGLCIINIAEQACVDAFFDSLGILAEAADKTDLKQLARALCGVQHFLCLRSVERHRLFAKNVDARLERFNRRVAMRAVPGRYADCIQIFFLIHFAAIGINRGNAVFFRIFLCLFAVDITACDHLDRIRQSLIAHHMILADPAGTDNTDSEFTIHIVFLPFFALPALSHPIIAHPLAPWQEATKKLSPSCRNPGQECEQIENIKRRKLQLRAKFSIITGISENPIVKQRGAFL